MIFRSMKMNSDGFPLCGESARCLGVRPKFDQNGDIPLDENGKVKPGTGGMSVFDDPDKLPKHRKPFWMRGGEGRDSLFKMDQKNLCPDLNLRYNGQKSHRW